MKRIGLFLFLFLSFGLASGCRSQVKEAVNFTSAAQNDTTLERATFAMGCFWHSEEIFSEIKGVKAALPGYAGGSVENPTYDEVCTSRTGHAECVDVTFDPKVVTYQKLVEVFFAEHDPTTRNRSGNDVGPQYRSAIFY